MPTKALGRRLSRLSQAGRTEEIGQIVIIAPDEWPIEAQATYEAACVAGDRERQADIIETQTGERPVFPRVGVGLIRNHLPIAVVEICTPSDGLQRGSPAPGAWDRDTTGAVSGSSSSGFRSGGDHVRRRQTPTRRVGHSTGRSRNWGAGPPGRGWRRRLGMSRALKPLAITRHPSTLRAGKRLQKGA